MPAATNALPGQFDTRVLIGLINKRPVLPGLFKNLFFPRRNPIPSKFAELEVLVGGKQLIPFVGDYSPGTVVGRVGRETRSVKCPRMRPKIPYRAPDLLDHSAPGAIAYVTPGETREMAMERCLALDLDNLKGRVETTIEYMCAQALKGYLSYAGEETAFTVDYLMPDAHKIVLGSGEKWTDEGVEPLEQMETWADMIVEACGLTPDVCVQGAAAWAAFRKNPQVRDDLDNRRIEVGQLAPVIGKAYRGTVSGVDIYRYGGTYQDSAGALQTLLGPEYIVFGCTQAETEITFGLPEDLGAGGQAMEYFSKAYYEEDPSTLVVLAESRPLPLPKMPDAYVYVKVV